MSFFKYAVLFLLFTGVGAAIGVAAANAKFTDNFYAMTGVTYQDFEESYTNCVSKGGELCNLYGGFAPKSKFRSSKP